MNLTNYHSHCLYCDGRADMDAFIRFAIAEGFHRMAFLLMHRFLSLLHGPWNGIKWKIIWLSSAG